MKTYIIYDSNYSNTKNIACVIAEVFGVHPTLVDEIKPAEIADADLLIVGSPINAWRPTQKIAAFLSGITAGQLKNVNAAAFDTRVKLFFSGNAAKKIAKKLEDCGAHVVVPPQGFYVEETRGPLEAGETERAEQWARELKLRVQSGQAA